MQTINPNDFGTKLLIEQCQKITVAEILRDFRRHFKVAMLSSTLEAAGIEIRLTTSKTRFGGIRYWFLCPICGRRVGVLYKHPLNDKVGCRLCLNLDYRNRRYKGMIEEKAL